MTLSRSPSPYPGRGWSSPGLIPASGTASPNGPSPGALSPGTPGSISWAAAKAKSDEVRGYPSFSTRNSGFFSRQRHKISTRFPSFRRLSSREYVDKDDYSREWKRSGSGRGLLGALCIPIRRGRLRLLFALFLVWIGYLFFWTSK
jgi:mannan polymerase II complex MNN10 subunit